MREMFWGRLMDDALPPRTVFLTITFIVVSLICQATIHCIQLFNI